MFPTKRYRCLKCGRTSVTKRARLLSCPFLEVVPPTSLRKPTYRCGGTLQRIKPPKTQGPTVATKLRAAEKNLAANVARMKRAATAVSKWKRKVAYYQKQVAAAAVAPSFPSSSRGARAIELE